MTARCWAVETEPLKPIRAEAFRSVFRRHPAGVAVVALVHDDRPVGFTATSVISVSAEPPILAFAIADSSSSWPALAQASTVTINFLAADQVDISARFATRGIDRFDGIEWSRLPTGEPVLRGVPSWIRGQVIERSPVGSSFLVALEALEVRQGGSVPPLVYHDRSYYRIDGDSAL